MIYFSANCLSVGEELIFIGCADGIVRCFSPHTLQVILVFVQVLSYPDTNYLANSLFFSPFFLNNFIYTCPFLFDPTPLPNQ